MKLKVEETFEITAEVDGMGDIKIFLRNNDGAIVESDWVCLEKLTVNAAEQLAKRINGD